MARERNLPATYDPYEIGDHAAMVQSINRLVPLSARRRDLWFAKMRSSFQPLNSVKDRIGCVAMTPKPVSGDRANIQVNEHRFTGRTSSKNDQRQQPGIASLFRCAPARKGYTV